MNPEKNLLVIDWDSFFRNPMMLNDSDMGEAILYDWQSNENGNFDATHPAVWIARASAFLARGRELPMCQGWEGFWSRFTFSDSLRYMLVTDSNYWTAEMLPDGGGPWSRIDLYDAHHDSGYSHQTLEEVHCGNWMWHHQEAGTEQLYVHYPQWRKSVENSSESAPKAEKVVRRIDPGGPVDVVYDAVFVCRSGAWVPPWCDQQFSEFLDLSPLEQDWPAELDMVMERPFDMKEAERDAAITAFLTSSPEAMTVLREAVERFKEMGEFQTGDARLDRVVRAVAGVD